VCVGVGVGVCVCARERVRACVRAGVIDCDQMQQSPSTPTIGM